MRPGSKVSAFSTAYGIARFCKRGRLVALWYGLRAAYKRRRFDAQGRDRVGL